LIIENQPQHQFCKLRRGEALRPFLDVPTRHTRFAKAFLAVVVPVIFLKYAKIGAGLSIDSFSNCAFGLFSKINT